MICPGWRAADDTHGTEVSRRLQPFETGLAALLRDRLLNHRHSQNNHLDHRLTEVSRRLQSNLLNHRLTDH